MALLSAHSPPCCGRIGRVSCLEASRVHHPSCLLRTLGVSQLQPPRPSALVFDSYRGGCLHPLHDLRDFKNERTALQHTVEKRGHILVLSPKFHPEVAGVGIEYSWGMPKLKLQRDLNCEVPINLHGNILASNVPGKNPDAVAGSSLRVPHA